MEEILSWDRAMMVKLNLSGMHNLFLDSFMWQTTQIFVWAPVVLFFLYMIFKAKRRDGFYLLLFIVLVFLLCDQISSSILKPWIGRLRPSRDPLVMNLLEYVYDYRGGQFGFPSSHAANSFGFAMFSSLLLRFRPYTVVAFVWAATCAYTRLYLGVHFPLDILCGTLLGLFCGWLCYYLYQKTPWSKCETFTPDKTISGFEKADVVRLIALLFVTFFLIFFFSYQQVSPTCL